MGPLDFLNHLLNFLAPALWMAVLMHWFARLFMKKQAGALSAWAQVAINFIVSGFTLVLGLWFFGHDGKMATYAGMAMLCASSQWWMQGLWRR